MTLIQQAKLLWNRKQHLLVYVSELNMDFKWEQRLHMVGVNLARPFLKLLAKFWDQVSALFYIINLWIMWVLILYCIINSLNFHLRTFNKFPCYMSILKQMLSSSYEFIEFCLNMSDVKFVKPLIWFFWKPIAAIFSNQQLTGSIHTQHILSSSSREEWGKHKKGVGNIELRSGQKAER